MSVEAKLEAIESKIEKLESKKKDLWDVFQIVAAALIPLAIAFAGNQYAKAMKDAEFKFAEVEQDKNRRIENTQLEIENLRVKVEQVGAVVDLLDPLVSENEIKRKLAVEAVLIALDVNGPKLAKIVEDKDKQEGVRVTAKQALATRKMILIQELFDEVPTVRKNAYQALLGTWRSDSTLPRDLIYFARDNKDNHDGIYNTLVLLSHMNKEALRQSVSEIKKFSREVEGITPKTKERAKKLRSRLPR